MTSSWWQCKAEVLMELHLYHINTQAVISSVLAVRSRYIVGIFLCITHERNPIVRPKRRCMGRRSWVQTWLKFYHINCCYVYIIASYVTAIYRESIVFDSTGIIFCNSYEILCISGIETMPLFQKEAISCCKTCQNRCLLYSQSLKLGHREEKNSIFSLGCNHSFMS